MLLKGCAFVVGGNVQQDARHHGSCWVLCVGCWVSGVRGAIGGVGYSLTPSAKESCPRWRTLRSFHKNL